MTTAQTQVTRTGQLITAEIEGVLVAFRRFREARTWGSDAEERGRYAQLEDAIALLERRVILNKTAPAAGTK